MTGKTTSVTQIAVRREKAQTKHDHGVRVSLHRRENLMALTVAPLLAWCLPDIQTGRYPLVTVFAGILTFAVLVTLGFLVDDYIKARRRYDDRVYVESLEGNDPHQAMPAVDALIDVLKSPNRDLRTLTQAYETATERLQAIRPRTPLSQMVRHGYYPSRPQERVSENVYRTVDHDVEDGTRHWERMTHAAEALRVHLMGDCIVTESVLETAIANLVPPLRAVLRTHGVQTWRIEYLPQAMPAMPAVTSEPVGRITDVRPVDRIEASPPPQPAAVDEDALTSVENRFNAAASMHAAALRTLATAFEGADDNLFLGDDRTTGGLMLTRHLPRLVAAFMVADNAATGEERDAVRADFARSLGVMRDSLEGIMARHVQAARAVLQDQTAFITQQHGPSAL